MSNRIRALIVGLLIVAAVLVASCAPAAPAAPPVVAKTPIPISLNVDLTGPMSTAFRYQYRSAQDFIGDLNAKGGIDGYKIDLIWADSKYDAQQSVTNWKKFEAAGTVLHCTTGSPEIDPLKDTWEKLQIPAFANSIVPSVLRPTIKTVYAPMANYTEWTMVIMNWAKADWVKKGNTGRPRMGFLGFQAAATQPILDTGALYAPTIGMDWGPVEPVPLRVLDTKAQVKRLADAGCNYVFLSHLAGASAVFMKDAVSMGVKDKMTWIINNPDQDSVAAAPTETEGIYMACYAPVFANESTGMTEYKDIQMKNHGEAIQSPQAMTQWLNYMIGTEAIRIALKDVGRDKLNGAAVIAALTKLKALDMKGLIPPITVTDPKEREFFRGIEMCQVQKSKIVPVADWMFSDHVILFEGKFSPLP